MVAVRTQAVLYNAGVLIEWVVVVVIVDGLSAEFEIEFAAVERLGEDGVVVDFRLELLRERSVIGLFFDVRFLQRLLCLGVRRLCQTCPW